MDDRGRKWNLFIGFYFALRRPCRAIVGFFYIVLWPYKPSKIRQRMARWGKRQRGSWTWKEAPYTLRCMAAEFWHWVCTIPTSIKNYPKTLWLRTRKLKKISQRKKSRRARELAFLHYYFADRPKKRKPTFFETICRKEVPDLTMTRAYWMPYERNLVRFDFEQNNEVDGTRYLDTLNKELLVGRFAILRDQVEQSMERSRRMAMPQHEAEAMDQRQAKARPKTTEGFFSFFGIRAFEVKK